jgi:hypothetical protein
LSRLCLLGTRAAVFDHGVLSDWLREPDGDLTVDSGFGDRSQDGVDDRAG